MSVVLAPKGRGMFGGVGIAVRSSIGREWGRDKNACDVHLMG